MRPIDLSLRKVDEVAVVTGELKTTLKLLCSRCALPVEKAIDPHFSSLFCKDPVLAGVGHLEAQGPPPTKKTRNEEREWKPAGRNQGHARHAHDYRENNATEATDDLDITYLAGDSIDLAGLLAEQIQLQIPFQPLCKEDCKGICPHCGTDWNTGRCACTKVRRENPFSVLKDIKFSS